MKDKTKVKSRKSRMSSTIKRMSNFEIYKCKNFFAKHGYIFQYIYDPTDKSKDRAKSRVWEYGWVCTNEPAWNFDIGERYAPKILRDIKLPMGILVNVWNRVLYDELFTRNFYSFENNRINCFVNTRTDIAIPWYHAETADTDFIDNVYDENPISDWLEVIVIHKDDDREFIELSENIKWDDVKQFKLVKHQQLI